MRKLINRPDDYVDEALAGLSKASTDIVIDGRHGRVARRRRSTPGKVGIVSGGGFGHLPLFAGYVGHGLLDACAVGNVFEGPNLDSCLDAIRFADAGAGVLLIVGNYGGDRMNFSMAAELASNTTSRMILVGDDIASADLTDSGKRRGVAGLIYAYKIAGAAADAGADLGTVERITRKALAYTRSLGLALSACHLPGRDGSGFNLESGQVELGMGIHGEPGLWRDALKPIDALVDELVDRLLVERPAEATDKLSVLVNGLGSTPLEELYIAYRRVAERLEEEGLSIALPFVGEFVTSMDMAGLSLTFCFLDPELERLLTAPARCPTWSVP